MTDDDIVKQKEWALDRAFSILEESFETVVIIASSPIPENRTMKLAKHKGDVYACIGMAMTFAKRQIDFLNNDMGEDHA